MVSSWTPRSLSVVVPVYNEEDNVEPQVAAIAEAVAPLGVPYEIVVVDDGSSDQSVERLRALLSRYPELVVVVLRRNFGQTLALQAGLDRARGEVIVTMDGDLQNEPGDIPLLVAEIERGADVVSGWRRDRKDTLFSRKFPSWVANRLIRVLTGVPIQDQGCSLKAYRRDVVRGLDIYGDMHRFIAILTMPLGAEIREVAVRHHPRTAGESKYGLSRIFKVMADLFSIQMITHFREQPLRWFILLAIPFLLISVGAASVAALGWDQSVVMPAISLLTAITFFSCLVQGVFGQALVALAGRRSRRKVVYRVWGDS